MNTKNRCPACDSPAVTRIVEIPEQMFGLPEIFTYAECGGCGSLWITDLPADLRKYYDTATYYSFDQDPETVMGRLGVRQAITAVGRTMLFGPHRAVERLVQHAPSRELRTLISILASVRLAGLPQGRKTSVLDVGAGAGTLVFALGLAGLSDVVGIDPFLAAERRLGRSGSLLRRELAEVEGTFDLIMLHHSLEHVPQPRRTLALAKERLNPGGRVLVRTPTISSEAYEEYGTSWIGCDAPRHITLFTREGIDRMATDIGLATVAVLDDSNESQFWASEQFRDGVPFVAQDSHFVNPKESRFDRKQIRDWRRRATRLNALGRGDQAAWVLAPST